MWDLVALVGGVAAVMAAIYVIGARSAAGKIEVLEQRNADLGAGVKQGGKAAEVTGDVLAKVRERSDAPPGGRSRIRWLLGDRPGPPADPPGSGAS